MSLLLLACGGAPATSATEPSPETPPPAATAPDVRVRIADEAPVDTVDPSITAAMEEAVRGAYTTAEQAASIRSEAVLHDLSVDEASQTRARVRVTLVRIADERICTVLEGGAAAGSEAQPTELRVIEAAMRAALRNFDREMTECLSGSAPPPPSDPVE